MNAGRPLGFAWKAGRGHKLSAAAVAATTAALILGHPANFQTGSPGVLMLVLRAKVLSVTSSESAANCAPSGV